MNDPNISDSEPRQRVERRVYRAVRNYLINEVGIKRSDIQTMMVDAVAKVADSRHNFIEAAIERAIGRRVAHYRHAGQAEFRKLINDAVTAEVQRVVGEEVRKVMGSITIRIGQV